MKERNLGIVYRVSGVRTRQAIPQSEPNAGKTFRERRRLQPSVAGAMAHGRSITGTAAKLYVNLGLQKRGLGRSKNQRLRSNRQHTIDPIRKHRRPRFR